jgi:hypothetical protein
VLFEINERLEKNLLFKFVMKLTGDLLLLFVGLCLTISTLGFSFEGNCKAFLDDGKFIDLSPLDNTTNPL